MFEDLSTFSREDELWYHGKVPKYFIKHALKIAAFIDETPAPVLDMGDANPKIKIIQEERGFEFTSCDTVDFDHAAIPGSWGTIICLEVLEHLFNPLFALENMKGALKPGGVIYLSTPGRPHFLWTDQHFHEIDDKRLGWLFRRAGLEVVARARISGRREWWWHLKGVRPFLRGLSRARVFKLKVRET